MAEVDFATWKQFVSAHPETHILQTAEWGELKKDFGWDVVRLIVVILASRSFSQAAFGVYGGIYAKTRR